jgi:hypothetical protein
LKQDFPGEIRSLFFISKLSAHILFRRHRRMCCPYFASSTSFSLAGRRNLPTFENMLAQLPRSGRELIVLMFERKVKSPYCITIFFQFIDFRPQYLFSNFMVISMPT